MGYLFSILVIFTGLNALFGVLTFIEFFSKKGHPYDEAFLGVGVLSQMVLLMASCFYLGYFITKTGVENLSLLSFDFIASIIGIVGNIVNFTRIDTAYSCYRSDQELEERLRKQKDESPQ